MAVTYSQNETSYKKKTPLFDRVKFPVSKRTFYNNLNNIIKQVQSVSTIILSTICNCVLVIADGQI